MFVLDSIQVQALIRRALEEDLSWGDVTSDSLFGPEVQATLHIVFKEAGMVAGLPIGVQVFEALDPLAKVETYVCDGEWVESKTKVASVSGSASALLKAERTALNILQRLSGIATATQMYVQEVQKAGKTTRIVDTRKTTPGLRYFEKYAVRVGGGHNHRFNLSDAVMFKDNHLALLGNNRCSLKDAIQKVRSQIPHTTMIEVEIDRLDQLEDVLEGGADVILLDNMSCDEMKQAVIQTQRRALLEASGNVNLSRVQEIAETGVDLISVGALTHSVKALDIGLEYQI